MTQLTIALVAYNEERHIAETIQSILNQTYRNYIFRIYNHGSTDSTGKIADQFAKTDPRIQVIHLKENRPLTVGYRVIQEIKTNFYMFVAGHDIYDERFIEACMPPLLRDKDIVLSYARAAFFQGNQITGNILGNINTQGMDALSRSLCVGYGLVYAYMFYGICRTSASKQIPHKPVVGHDHVVLAELALFGTFSEIPEVLFFMRQTDDFGNQESYKQKHYRSTPQERHLPFLRTTKAYMEIADRIQDDIDRDLMKLAYFTQALIRNRNILDMYGCTVRSLLSSPEMQGIKAELGHLIKAIETKFEGIDITSTEIPEKTLLTGSTSPASKVALDFTTGALPEIEQLQVHDADYAQRFFPLWNGDLDSIRFEYTKVAGRDLLCIDMMLRARESSFLALAVYIEKDRLVFPASMASAGKENLAHLRDVVVTQIANHPKQYEFRTLSSTPRIVPEVARDGRALPGVCDYTTATNHLRRYLFLNEIGLCGSVLECAAGTGYGAAILSRNTSIEKYVGIDLDIKAIEIARGMVDSPVFSFETGALSEHSGQFDYVLSLETIEHVSNPFVFLRELQAKLKPGGTLIATIPAERWAGNHLNPDHLTNWTYHRFQRFFAAHFEEIEIHLQQLSLLGPTPLESAHIYNRTFVESRDEDFIVIARKPKPFNAPTIVVKRTEALGDVLWITPILAELRARNPDAFITAMTHRTEALMRNPDVDLVGTLDYCPNANDRVIDLDGAYEQRRKEHLLTAYSQVSGLTPARPDPIFSPYPDDLADVSKLLQEQFGNSKVQTLIGIHAGATSPDRIWPAEHWSTLINMILQQPDTGILLIGHNRDLDSQALGVFQHPRVLDFVRRFNLSLSGATLAHCDLLVCVDSGMLHLATAVGTSSVALFGMARPETRLPFVTPASSLFSPAVCHGCLDELPAEAIPVCKFGIGKSICMSMITPDAVISAINAMEADITHAKWRHMLPPRSGCQPALKTPKKTLLDEGISAFHNNDLEGATKILAPLLDTLPDNPLPLAYLAFICATQGLDNESENFICKALELAPNRVDLKAGLGEIFMKSGNPALAEKYLQEAIDAQPDLFSAYPALAEAMRLNGQKEKATQLLLSAATIPSAAQDVILELLLEWFTHTSNITAIVKLCHRLLNKPSYYSLGLALASRSDLSLAHLRESVQAFLAKYPSASPAPAQASAPLTIAFLTSNCHQENINGRLENILLHLPPTRFKTIVLWNDSRHENEVIQRSSLISDWSSVIVQNDDAALLELIATMDIQVLIDLDGLGIQHRLSLFLAAPVPVKLSWSDTALPLLAGIPCLHGEALWPEPASRPPELQLLPGLGEYLDFPDFAIEPRNFARPFTFACLCNPAQYGEDSWNSFARLLTQALTSRLLINLGELGDDAQRFISEHFQHEGIDIARLEFINASTPDAIAAAWNRTDLGLAPLNGPGDIALPLGLWMEKPYLAVAGNAPWSRRPAALLHTLGQDSFVTETVEAWLNLGTRFSNITRDTRIIGLRSDMTKKGIVGHAENFALAFAELIEKLHQKAC